MAPHFLHQAPPGGTERSEPCRGSQDTSHFGATGPPSLSMWGRKAPAGHSQPDRPHGTGSHSDPPAQSLVGPYLGGDVGNRARKAILRDGAVGAVGRAGARTWRTVTHGGHCGRGCCYLGLLGAAPLPNSPALRTGTRDKPLPPGPAPVISTALFLKVLMTVPSLRRKRGLLLRSATFCFSLERTFKLGSEAGEKAAGTQTRPHKQTHLQPGPSTFPPLPNPAPKKLTCFAEGEVIAAVVGPKQRQFIGGRRPRRAALGRGTLVQRSMVGSPAGWRQGMETRLRVHPDFGVEGGDGDRSRGSPSQLDPQLNNLRL